MPKLKNTPGPWEAERDDDRELYDIGHRRVPVGQRCVATVTFGYDEPAETEQHANAKLIATAPELLDLAFACEMWLSTHPEGKKMQEVCRAAITRATGKEFTP